MCVDAESCTTPVIIWRLTDWQHLQICHGASGERREFELSHRLRRRILYRLDASPCHNRVDGFFNRAALGADHHLEL